MGLSTTNSYSDQNRARIEKKLAEVIALMNEGEQIHLKPVDDVNVQKKIDPQIRLYSTRKKNCQKTQISKPTVNETNVIVSGLENVNSESVLIHDTFDHSYI